MPKAPKTWRKQERRKEREEMRGNCVQRGYDWEWMKISKLYRQSHAVCEICNNAVSVDVDHIIPFRGLGDPLRTDWHNLQAVCRRCHAIKTNIGGNKVCQLVVVTGPPDCGKTTYVNSHAGPDDVIWDWDVIVHALNPNWGRRIELPEDVKFLMLAFRQQLIAKVKSGLMQRVTWMIVSDENTAKEILGGTPHVFLRPPYKT